eukprot:g3053.t1
MISMKTKLVALTILALMVRISDAKIYLEHLEGEYMGHIVFPTLVSRTEDNRVTNFCRSKFSKACLKEVGLPVERIAINESGITFTIVQSEGIKSKEQSIEAYPSCAKGKIYPVEYIGAVPPMPIESYDPITGHLIIKDLNRKDNVNCIIITPGRKGIRVKYILTLDLLPENEGTLLGPMFRCSVYDGICISETTIEGNFVSFVDVDYHLPCVSGACEKKTNKESCKVE